MIVLFGRSLKAVKVFPLAPISPPLKEFVQLQSTFLDSKKSWLVDISNIDPITFDLSVKNPNMVEEVKLRDPEKIIAEIATLDAQSNEILKNIKGIV